MARPPSTSAAAWTAYLAFVCSGLSACTGFSSAGWLKAERAGFGQVGGRWYALSSWEVVDDPAGPCAGMYVRHGWERGGCPQASGFFFLEGKDSSGGDLVAPQPAGRPSLAPTSAGRVAGWAAECEGRGSCLAFNSFGVLRASLTVRRDPGAGRPGAAAGRLGEGNAGGRGGGGGS